MATQLFTNNAKSVLAANLTAIATSLSVTPGDGLLFPSPTGGNYFLLTLAQMSTAGEINFEVVKVTARSTDTFTIVRAQEGTTALAYVAGDKAELRLTKETMEGLRDFTQDGTGAVARTIRDRLLEVISVKDFGATGDGVTDDAAAIQLAATAAAGKVLLFPPGTYVCDDGFAMAGDNSHIVGYGATITYNATTTTAHHCIRLSGDDCSISGIAIVSPSGLVRDDTGFGISVGIVGTLTNNVTIRDCVLDSIGSAGVWVSKVQGFKAFGNTVRNCLADGIHLSDGSYNAVISGNILTNNGDDNIAVVHDGATAATGLVGETVIDSNVIRGGTWGTGVALIGAFDCVVSNNVIQDTVGPGISTYLWLDPDIASRSSYLVIEGNEIVNTGAGAGSGFGGCGIYLGDSQVVSVSNNNIHNIAYDVLYNNGAIRCDSATYLSITGNYFYDNASEHVIVTSATNSASIMGNHFGYTTRTAVLVSGTVGTCIVHGNVMNGTSGTYDVDINLPSGQVSLLSNRMLLPVSVTCSNSTTYDDPNFPRGVTLGGNLSAAGSVLSTGTAGIGYGAGAGGTVVQATSRTTAVTLDKMSGRLTMFTAAGSPTPQTFTVNNSLVLSSDHVVVHLKSGASNNYVFNVAAVNTGSFVIQFFAAAGTSTDTPLLSVGVFRGVTS